VSDTEWIVLIGAVGVTWWLLRRVPAPVGVGGSSQPPGTTAPATGGSASPSSLPPAVIEPQPYAGISPAAIGAGGLPFCAGINNNFARFVQQDDILSAAAQISRNCPAAIVAVWQGPYGGVVAGYQVPASHVAAQFYRPGTPQYVQALQQIRIIAWYQDGHPVAPPPGTG